ncbi:hypothetical protein FSP39_025081 [Pinctada imbricata]|uniref:Uncharacterized protein n=1 Tax=Pinctada imbricata TaxID=66713 RepID=A0AA88XKD1_PINIB|nr:hypothetical protein FSP39_025081 [Pinctada imbricata]
MDGCKIQPGSNLGGSVETKLKVGTEESFLDRVQECYEGVVDYVSAWRKFDGAGTYLLDSLQAGLQNSGYEMLGQETSKTFKEIHCNNNGVNPGGKIKEMEKLLIGLKSHLEVTEQADKTHSQLQQVLCQCVLLFLRVQSDYHTMCSNAIASLLQVLFQVYTNTENKSVLQQMSDLDLLPQPSRHSPSRSPNLLKKKSPSSSPKVQAKHGSRKSSFFSLFEKKMPSEESKSAFYVDLEKPSCSQSDSLMDSRTNQSDVLIQIGLDPVQEDESGLDVALPSYIDKNSLTPKSSSSSGEQRTKSPLATEEDLDSVINLLSGFSGPSNYMQSIPENNMQLRVPSTFSSRTPSPRELDESMKIGQGRQQRLSDGALDLTGVGHARGYTWPHRSSLPSGCLHPQIKYPDYTVANSNLPRRYSNEFGAHARSTSPGYPVYPGVGNFSSGFQYGTHEGPYSSSRTWPFVPLSSQGSDTVNSSWSAVQDSDDMSDDSSCGEQFFAVGLDLVQAMDSK